MPDNARAAVVASSFVLEHVPDLVRYGSKPAREPERAEELTASLRSFADAVAYPPNQVFIGNRAPGELWDLSRPWWSPGAEGRGEASEHGVTGEILGQSSFYELLAEVDMFDLVRLKDEPRDGELSLTEGDEVVGAVAPAHDSDASLAADVLLENLAVKATAVHAVRHLLSTSGTDPAEITLAIGCGEEAIGDRYQRGGGNLAKAVAEHCGLEEASGLDVKSFCAAPVHALAVAAAMIESGIERSVLVLSGGSLAKLGMKFEGALAKGVPILENVLAGLAILLGPSDGSNGPILRTDAVGRMPVRAASTPQDQLGALVGAPLDALGIGIKDVDVYATEIHNPEITEPQGGGDVPDRNYRMLSGLGVTRGELTRDDIPGFARSHGMPGFSPTQGHIASAVPWLPHALRRFEAGELRRTMLIAKGSLFLGRMTRSWDGASVVLEA
jgi:betaine reductase